MSSAVVVGSGPNGLAAALTLAAAGVSVTVVEAADRIGGGVRSSELTVPGLVHDDCAGFHPFATASAFAREFDLEGAGLRWRWAPYEFAHPLDGGRGAVLQRSVAETARVLGADGGAWMRTFGPLAERFDTISEEFLQPVVHAPEHPIHLARFGRAAAQPAALLVRRWRLEAARALYGGVAAHAFTRLDRPFSAAVGVALTTAAHAYGWPVAEGGSQAIAEAVWRRCEERGVKLELGRTVSSIDELGAVDLVLLDTAPGAAARIVGDRLPRRVRRAYESFRHGPAAFKVDYAVQTGVPWDYEPARSAGTIHLGGTFEETARAEADTNAGRMPQRPFVLVGQQWLADRTRSVGDVHPLYAYAHVPAGYDGPDGPVVEAITARIEQFAPGFRERIVATHVRSATAMEAYNANYVGGDIATGATGLRQMVFRPRVGTSPYSTGAKGIYLCSAATPPGAGAHGMCGHLAAKAALRSLG
ncbi:MAG: NAD(P)/FAD-dependent oxidoreductase [Nocardioidaceae bacterium]|nr:NAD(P)/FAD-dependent oxidoreductase [Nocardioidaceae bacterium]MCL2612903.1 NAD(P)/FAD-dependent oxidoreductase [Nocardioidaceae bacterium]